MSFYLILLLLVASLVAVTYRRRRLVIALLSITVVLYLVIDFGFLAAALLGGLQTYPQLQKPDWKTNNVIMVLGFGTTQWPDGHHTSGHFAYARTFEAARLYFECKKSNSRCRIVATGGDPQKLGANEADMVAQDLRGIGVPAEDVLTETKSNNTFQNARFSRETLASDLPDNLVLVTSGPHLRRSLLYVSHFFHHPVPAPSDYVDILFGPSAMHFEYFDFAAHEYGGIVQYYLYNTLGWNPPAVSK